TPFFRSWELAGNYPKIMEDPVVGESARALFADAKAMLERIINERWLKPKAVIGFWPAQARGDDVVLYDEAGKPLSTVHFLRQQVDKREGAYDMCLADFIAPESAGYMDYM